MTHKADWASYLIAAIYATLLIGCCRGIHKNMRKKENLLQKNLYEKQRRVIRWRYRFYFTLLSASIVRIACILCSVILQEALIISEADTQAEFLWSFFASIGSMLFYSSFSFIIWFFAHLAFHQQETYKKGITPFFTGLNVTLYVSLICIAISSVASEEYDLIFMYVLPLFAICAWILAISFIYLSFKISSSIQRETEERDEYVETSRRMSLSQNPPRPSFAGGSGGGSAHNSPLMGSQPAINSSFKHKPIMPVSGAPYGDLESSVSRNYGNILPASSSGYQSQQLQRLSAQSSNHIIRRLIRLSLLCAFCWIVRGMYSLAIRIWPSTDRTPFDVPAIQWEAVFYFLTEYPPSLGALIWMISKPKRGSMKLSMHESVN